MIRIQITPRILADDFLDTGNVLHEAGSLHLLVEAVEILDGEKVHKVHLIEEHFFPPDQIGSDLTEPSAAYVTRLRTDYPWSLSQQGGTFWTDWDGNQHYMICAEPGDLNKAAKAAAIT